MDTRYERQLKRGVLEIVVLKLLSQGRAYGYQLLQRLDQESGGLFRIKEGTLYPILYRLEDDGLVVSEWSIPEDKSVAKKYYRCTPKGEEALVELLELWRKFDRVANHFYKGRMGKHDKGSLYPRGDAKLAAAAQN